MKDFVIYLAGASKDIPDEGRAWRKEVEARLYTYADLLDFDVNVFNPNDFFTYKEKRHKTNRQVKEFYICEVLKSDLVLVNLNHTNTSPGTAQETQAANMRGIPIIGFGTENVYPWISEGDCQVAFDTMKEAIEYIVNFYFRP